MTTKLSLSQLSIYNPQRLDDQTVELLFVIRKKFFDYLFKKIVSEEKNSIPQHYLIIAQRGMGKTTLLKRIEVELRKEVYFKDFIPLLFPEEQYNLNSLAKFWLNSLDALADTLEEKKLNTEAKNVDEVINTIVKLNDEEQQAQDAYQYLVKYSKTYGRRPVLLIDNMSLIFDRLRKEDQHILRAMLMKNNAPIIVGASVMDVMETSEYGFPFYDAFQKHYLNKLTYEELIELLKNLAVVTDSENIIPEINQEIARLKTIHQLTGGNPRTAVMLFKLIVKGFSKNINDDLEALLDEVTPIYKARFEELSEQLQIILDVIALHWEPIYLEQIRTITGFENNQLSPQIKRLVEAGWIERITTHISKANAYQISERFFNIWFIMRRSSRRQKKELYALSRFLESLYGDEIINIAQMRLKGTYSGLNDLKYNLALCDTLQESDTKTKLQKRTYEHLTELAQNDVTLLKDYEAPQPIVYKVFRKKLTKFKNYFDKKNYSKAEKELLEILLMDNINKSDIYNNLGYLYQECLYKYQEAEDSYLKSISINENDAYPWDSLGYLYMYSLQKYHEAEAAFLKAIALDNNLALPWNGLGYLYNIHLKKYKEAEKAYLKAISLDKNYAEPWNGLGNLYQDNIKDYTKSEHAYLKAISLGEETIYPKYNLVFLYRDKLNDIEKAENLFNTISLEFVKDIEDSYWLNKTLFELYKRNEGIAEAYFIKALESIKDNLPNNTQDDWWRFGAVVYELGNIPFVLKIMQSTGHDLLLAPYFVALQTLIAKDPKGFLNSKAAELREPAQQIMDIILNFTK